jgi:peptidoglycan/xylan/chitin deacetylase (PgdA/CDA1 family)
MLSLMLFFNYASAAVVLPTVLTTDNSCGIFSNKIVVCGGPPNGPCCSQYGWCGSTSAYCGTGCVLNCTTKATTTKVTTTKATSSSVIVSPTTSSSVIVLPTTSSSVIVSPTTTSLGGVTPSPTNLISKDGTCGGNVVCPNGGCCSVNGWCGNTQAHCGLGCQSQCSFVQAHQIYYWCNSKSQLTLTFDDGPSTYTNDVAVYLNSLGIKATFFMIGQNMVQFPDIVKNVFNLGHSIGVHTYTHPHLTALNNATILSELTQTINYAKQLTGVAPKYFRPPYSDYNNIVLELAYSVGLNTVLFNLDSGDWENDNLTFTEPLVLNGLTTGSNNGGILDIMHDIHSTVLALTKYTVNNAKNYQIVDLQTCIGI